MKARELMTENPECLTEGDSIQRAAQLMRDLDVGLIPVVDDASNRRLRGVITDRDIAIRHVAEGHDSGECRVGDEMSTGDIRTVGPDDDLDTVLSRMSEAQVRRMPVVDDDRIIGIIAQADLTIETGRKHAKDVERTIEKISEPTR